MNTADNFLPALLRDAWWMLLIRGLAAIAFGVIGWMMPGISLATLVLLFGSYALADGLIGIWTAIRGRKDNEDWWLLLIWALISLVTGVLTFMSPGITALALVFYIAAWAVATGLMQIVAAIRLRKQITGEWLLILAGLSSVAFGVLIMAQPGPGALMLLWLIASYAIFFGILMVFLSFKLKSSTQPQVAPA